MNLAGIWSCQRVVQCCLNYGESYVGFGEGDGREICARSVADFAAASTLVFAVMLLWFETNRKETVWGTDCKVEGRAKIRDTTRWLE